MITKSLIVILISFTTFMGYGASIDVESHILKAVSEQVSKECSTCKVELRILNKKHIEDIAIPDRVFADYWKGQTNLVLQLGDKTRIVTTDIRWFDQVVVAKKNIKQGALIKKADLRQVDKDVTFLKKAYLQSPKQAIGFIGKRIFQRGQIIDEAMLKKPLVIRFGQPVKLQIKEGALDVIMIAKARGSGAIGDRIPVLIPSTRKKVFAKIINQNIVRVE